jgi:hypothetical protein
MPAVDEALSLVNRRAYYPVYLKHIEANRRPTISTMESIAPPRGNVPLDLFSVNCGSALAISVNTAMDNSFAFWLISLELIIWLISARLLSFSP